MGVHRQRVRLAVRPEDLVGVLGPGDGVDWKREEQREKRQEERDKNKPKVQKAYVEPFGPDVRTFRVRRGPEFQKSKRLRGEAFKLMGEDPGRALELFEEAIPLDKSSAGLRVGKAISLMKLGRLDEGLEVAESALKECSLTQETSTDLESLLGELHMKKGDPMKAIPHLRRALKFSPDSEPTMLWLGHAYASAGDYEGAVKAYCRIPADSPQCPKALASMGELYLRSDGPEGWRDEEKAELFSKMALNRDEDNVTALKTMADLRFRQGSYSEAQYFAERGLSVEPDNPRMLGELAESLRKQRKHLESIQACERLLGLKPNDHDCLNCRGFDYVELGWRTHRPEFFEHAEADFQRVLEMQPNEKRATRGMAYMNMRYAQELGPASQGGQERLALAGTYLYRLVELDPNGDKTRENLGFYAEVAGHPLQITAEK